MKLMVLRNTVFFRTRKRIVSIYELLYFTERRKFLYGTVDHTTSLGEIFI
jgi:hypothetical protein